jgi:hypothetical protein
MRFLTDTGPEFCDTAAGALYLTLGARALNEGRLIVFALRLAARPADQAVMLRPPF